jgi:hypothetical protein
MRLFPQLCFLSEPMSCLERLYFIKSPDTLYDLQNIYSKLAERYAADLRKAEADADSDWTKDT